MSKIQKPNWSLLELHEKCDRQRDLIHDTRDHSFDCQCNLCMELFSLDALIDKFSNDEVAASVIEAGKNYEKQ